MSNLSKYIEDHKDPKKPKSALRIEVYNGQIILLSCGDNVNSTLGYVSETPINNMKGDFLSNSPVGG